MAIDWLTREDIDPFREALITSEGTNLLDYLCGLSLGEAWVGAPQTGTFGFFHDRSINLDGKVNPEALDARLENRILRDVVESKIDYLLDWAGIAEWKELPDFKEVFELVVEDRNQNLAVLRRINTIQAPNAPAVPTAP